MKWHNRILSFCYIVQSTGVVITEYNLRLRNALAGSGSADGDIQDTSSSEPDSFPVDERSTPNSVIRQGMLDSSSPSRENTNVPIRPRTSFPSDYQVGESARIAALPSSFRGEDAENDDDQTEQQSDEQSKNGNKDSRMEFAHCKKQIDESNQH